MKGNIRKKMAKKMKRKENIEAKPGGNQLAPKTDCEEKKKMVVIFSSKRKIIFSEMDKFK
jgi:hypothetical protein